MATLVTSAAFPAMSTTVEITGVGVPAREVARAAALGRGLAQQWEEWFSRFRPDSQLNRLNAAGGAAVRVEADVLNLLATVKAAVRRTGGRFDPSVLPALEAIGYDRSIERVRSSPCLGAGEPRPAAGPQGWDSVRIDRAQGEAQLPPGMRIDLGGVAKGAFVDRLASELRSWPGGCVDAGGDLLIWGSPPDGDRWRIGIEDPFQPERDALVTGVLDGSVVGVATSGTYRRSWFADGRMAHHLIDPSSGSPLLDGLRLVTAFAPDVMSAEIATKALMVAATGPSIPDSFGATMAVLIYADGHTEALAKEPCDACSLSVVWPDRSAA
jgi:thiamine biosynthesis lipoprotein